MEVVAMARAMVVAMVVAMAMAMAVAMAVAMVVAKARATAKVRVRAHTAARLREVSQGRLMILSKVLIEGRWTYRGWTLRKSVRASTKRSLGSGHP